MCSGLPGTGSDRYSNVPKTSWRATVFGSGPKPGTGGQFGSSLIAVISVALGAMVGNGAVVGNDIVVVMLGIDDCVVGMVVVGIGVVIIVAGANVVCMVSS